MEETIAAGLSDSDNYSPPCQHKKQPGSPRFASGKPARLSSILPDSGCVTVEIEMEAAFPDIAGDLLTPDKGSYMASWKDSMLYYF